MEKTIQPEVWLRGPLPGIAPLLQPVAHALLQAKEEVNEMLSGFPEDKLWDKVAGMAPVGFHLQHLSGVLDRLFTYAKGDQLNKGQLSYLASEGMDTGADTKQLLAVFNKQVAKALNQLTQTDGPTLTRLRGVGRAQLPSTVIGLLFHSAEHTMRHTGQLLVTVQVLKQ